jgi:hypothetical protein
MCLMVWIGSMRPLPERHLVNPQVPDPVLGYHHVEWVEDSDPIRGRFTLPHVALVGSHEGCGCAYNTGEFEWQGFERLDEVVELLEALTKEERDVLEADQRSRERLRDLVVAALADGPVEVFGCWVGDEAEPALREEVVQPSYFTTRIAPIVERVRYLVRIPTAVPDARP